MATITIRYFAGLREKLGRGEQLLDLNNEETAEAIFSRATGWPMPPNTLVAINQEYAAAQQHLRAGDEVAFFPPVTGG